MHPRAIVFDLDGTLAKSKTEVGSDVGELLKELLEYVPVAVMSGGSWKQFETQLLPALPSDTNLSKLYLFPVSAGECRTYENGAWKVLYTHAFKKEERDQRKYGGSVLKTEVHRLPSQLLARGLR